MIIDTTRTKEERDFVLADIQEQLKQIVNDPNLTVNCHCGKTYCLEDHEKEFFPLICRRCVVENYLPFADVDYEDYEDYDCVRCGKHIGAVYCRADGTISAAVNVA
jgi:hypothetical protein